MARKKIKQKVKAPRISARPLDERQPHRSSGRASGGDRGEQFPIIAVGASAGGIEAFQAFFRPFPAKTGMAFVVLTHLDPRRESLLPSIIGRWTAMPAVQASAGDRVIADKIFVIPPNHGVMLWQGTRRIFEKRDGALPEYGTSQTVTAATLAADTQQIVLDCEETLLRSHWRLAKSKMLLDAMNDLRREEAKPETAGT
jgi:hypothetical protein